MTRAFKKCGSLVVVFAMLSAFAGYVVASAVAAGASTTTVTVGSQDFTAPHATTAQLQWAPEDTDANTGTYGIVTGPVGAPGTGSLAMSVTNTQHEWIVSEAYGGCAGANFHEPCAATGTLLSSISALSYMTYRTAGGQMPTFNIEVSSPGDGTGYTTYVYVPDSGSYLNNTWQTWNPFSDSTARWYSTHNVTNPPGGTFNCAPQTPACTRTWSDIVTSYPNARILIGIGPNVGTGGTFTGNVDDVTIGVGGNSTVYDFEPICTQTCYVNGTTGSDTNTGTSTGSAMLTIQAAVNRVSAGGTVVVAAGTYNESVTIPKAVTLNGANVGTAGTASRVAESTVQLTSGSNSVFNITTADPVTINGFHAVYTGSQQTGGLLLSLQANNKLTFTNNLVNNSSYVNALIFDDSAATSVVTNNKFDSISQNGTPGSCVLCPWGQPGAQANVTITGNTFSNLTDTDGVPTINLDYVKGTVTGNTFNNIHQYGVLMADQLGPLTISQNTFTAIHNDTPMSSQRLRGSGIRTFSTPTFVDVVNVTMNTFSGDYNGVRVANDGSPATLNSNFSVTRNAFTGNTHEGISVASGTLGTPLAGACNWWGSATGPSGAGPGSGDAVSSGVTFGNWLMSSNLNGSCATAVVNSGPDQTIAEGDGGNQDVSIPVTLSSAQASAVTAHYTTVNGTAKKGTDFIAQSGTVTIPAGMTSANIHISVNGDAKAEKNEAFTVTLSAPVGAIIQHPTTTINLMNDDLKAKHIKSASGFAGGDVVFTLRVTDPIFGATTFQYSASGGNAPPADYASGCANVSLPSQALSVQFSVHVNNNPGHNEAFNVHVTSTRFPGFSADTKGTIKRTVA